MLPDEFKTSEVLANPFVAGAAGSLLGIKSMSGTTWGERFLHLIIGAVCAGYGGPALTDWMHMDSVKVQSFMAFGVGAFGISIYMALVDAIKKIDWTGVITSILPKR
jgi:hypothetical protein